MKLINIVNPSTTYDGWSMLIYCISAGFKYPEASIILAESNYYVPEDLYNCITNAFLITLDLDIGPRQNEFK